MRQFTILFMGPQGSGKGTQVELLENALLAKGGTPVHRIETGKAFRIFADGGSVTQKLVREGLERGARQPDFLATMLFGSSLVETVKENGQHIVVDGYPRTVPQAEVFDDAMRFYERSPIHIIALEIDEEKTIERLRRRGRPDDTEQSIRERLRWYREGAAPIIEFYRSRPGYVIVAIDADQPAENVHRDIMDGLERA